MGPGHIGVYQRPAPPKRPLGLRPAKTIQQSPVAMHEIESEARALAENILAARRKRGRPSIHEHAMAPAERQARRRAAQSRQHAIREALQIGDAHGKSHAEARSGGWGQTELDHVYSTRGDDESSRHPTTGGGRQAESRPSSDDEKSHKVRVHGLEIGDEETNRRLFTENELREMVREYFASADKTPLPSWIVKHVGNISVQRHGAPSLTLTCNLCADSMESIEDATDHLRVDHRKIIEEWFAKLVPVREFRDMQSFVTVVTPRKHRSLSGS